MSSSNLKYGIVSEFKPGFAKVYFEEDGFATDWWPIVVRGSLKDKDSYTLHTNEHVACLADERCEDGVVLGAIYNDTDTPDGAAADGKVRQLFADGNYMEYDNTAHKLKASIQGMTIECDGQLLVQKGGDTLKQALVLIVEAVQPIVVLYGNNPVYSKLAEALTKINALLK